jgi:ATP-binding cassette, subfamily C (CFTR/MRP), member 10
MYLIHALPLLQTISSAVSAATWWFYSAALCLETARTTPLSRSLLAALTILTLLEMLQLPRWHVSAVATDRRVHLVLVLHHTRVALTCAVAFLALIVASAASPVSESASAFDRASFLSRVSYHWISPLIRIGQLRRLEIGDVPQLPREDATTRAARRFQHALNEELRRPMHEASFLRVLYRLYAREIACFGLWSTLNKLIGLASPLLIKLFLDWAASQPSPDLTTGYELAVAMVIRSLIASVSGTQYSLAWKRFDLRVRAGLITAIYDRTLRVRLQTSHGVGHITNLVSVDVGRLVGMPGTFFDLFLIPVEIVFSLVLLAHEVQYAFIGGVVVLACMLPIQTLLGGKIQSVTTQMLAFRDQRVDKTAASLKAMRTLKLLAWVDVFLAKIEAYRQLEMHQLTIRKYLDAFCVFFWASTPVVVQTSVFVLVVYSGRDLTAANAFTAVALLDRLIYPMNYFPWIINGFLEARVSALRIRNFLFPTDPSAGEFSSPAMLPPSPTNAPEERHTVEAEDVMFAWRTSDPSSTDEAEVSAAVPLLREVQGAGFCLHLHMLHLQSNTTYVVCGSVGAGKSSLLMALLGEMPMKKGRLAVRQSRPVAYAPQTPWLFNGTVRDNITMGACVDESLVDTDLYERVLRVCELDTDLRMRKAYDLTQVSDGGTNFSGGQKIRVNLARALYQRAQLYLLDDPLSGLDAKTARAVVRNCYRERIFPTGSTVVITTHAIQLVDEFPDNVRILVMADGEIVEEGVLTDLKSQHVGEGDASSKVSFGAMLRAVAAQTVDRAEATPLDGSNSTYDTTTENHSANASRSMPAGEEDEEEDQTSSLGNLEEHRVSGAVHFGVWIRYATAIGWPLAVAILVAVTIMQVSRNGLDWWIAVYTNSHSVTPHHFASMLLWITFVNCVAVFFRAFLFAYGGLQAARAIYADLVAKIFRASLAFFDATPVGRILNRLSGDTYSVDESLPFILNIFLKDLADVVGTLAILFYGNKFVLLLLLPLGIIYVRLQAQYRPLSRHVQRLESTTQSPILSMFTETLEGLSVIRAMKLQKPYGHTYETHLNRNQRMAFLGANAGSWFGIRLDMLGVCVTSFVALFAVLDFQLSGRVHPGVLGLTLTYALPVVSKLNTILGSFVDTERQMIAVERVKEYADLPPEEETAMRIRSGSSLLTPPTWPVSGEVSVANLTVVYPAATGHVVALHEINCTFQAGEKIGICGRTGAGKSTFLLALFRAVAWAPGSSISIDGVSIHRVPLEFLRSRLTYVPQDVVLFAGTVRSNLDPQEKVADHELWACLARAGLDTAVSRLPHGLDSDVASGEGTFSKGQAQLLCFARALLRRSKVLCIDEATSSIDYETERLITKVRMRVGIDYAWLISWG